MSVRLMQLFWLVTLAAWVVLPLLRLAGLP